MAHRSATNPTMHRRSRVIRDGITYRSANRTWRHPAPWRDLGVRELLSLALSLLLIACLSSCSKKGEDATKEPHFEIEKKAQRGPVTFFVKVDKKEITIADRLHMLLEVRAEEGYEAELPKFGEKLEQFGIVDYRTPPPKLVDDGKVRTQKAYTLEPFLSGEYKIPPMKVTFWKKDEAEPKKHELESEEITITVKSMLPEKVAELKIKDIKLPVELPQPSRGWLYFLVPFGMAAAVIVIVLLRRRRGDEGPFILRRPAHEIAYDELEQLVADKLVEQGQTKLFYQRLSDILRHYIENRFSLHAPESTTEEFLADLRDADALEAPHKELLEQFLYHCDLVKFAEHQPTNDEIEKAFDAAKQFIAETESTERQVVVGTAA